MGAHTTRQYVEMLQGLLPPGEAWNREEDAVLSRVLEALAAPLRDVEVEAYRLADEALPQTTAQLLEDWERVCGLPDACSAMAETLAERRGSVLYRLAATGGQSRDYFEELARAYTGMDCAVSEYRPFRAGQNAAGDAVHGEQWLFAWRMHAPEAVITEFRAGGGTAGAPLRTWGNEPLECIIEKLKPAHTHVIFTYGEEA